MDIVELYSTSDTDECLSEGDGLNQNIQYPKIVN